MERFTQLISKFKDDIEMTKNLISSNDLIKIEAEMNIKIGPQLAYYILNYGYLAMGPIEFNGINSIQQSQSDMVKNTKSLHEHHPISKDFIVFYNPLDSIYYLVDSFDMMYYQDTVIDTIKPLNIDLISFVEQELKKAY